MIFKNYSFKALFIIIFIGLMPACIKLKQEVFSVVPDKDFWQTSEQVKAGIAPGYQALTQICQRDVWYINESSTDEMIAPTRGGDWFGAGIWQQMWKHTWQPSHQFFDGAWRAIFNGIGRINFSLLSLDNLEEKPGDFESIVAELKVLRAYYYWWALDLFGNVPLVINYQTDPLSVSNSARVEVFDFIEKEIQENIDLLSDEVGASTYGRMNKWSGLTLLAKLYLNAEVYTGRQRWQDCLNTLNSIIGSGKYSLSPGYYDNFSPDNGPESSENIFVVPFDKVNITGRIVVVNSLHYQSQATFQLTSNPSNGFSAAKVCYDLYDTTSVYSEEGERVYRTFLDQRTGQWLIGQQYRLPYAFPPDKRVLFKAEDFLKLQDQSTGLDLIYTPVMNTISDPNVNFRLAGVRNIKYFPEPGTFTNSSNDEVLFRYADVLLMKAECELRLSQDISDALANVNEIRRRAYNGSTDFDWDGSNLTLESLLDERGREFAWEMTRRQDMIRFEVASGIPIFSAARIPDKELDPSDRHLMLFPIPTPQIIANPNLKQNPGY